MVTTAVVMVLMVTSQGESDYVCLELEPDARISNSQQLVAALLRDSPDRDML